MSNLYCIAVYGIHEDRYMVRKCCNEGYRWHRLKDDGIPTIYGCTCELTNTHLTKDEALQIGSNLANKFNIPLEIDQY